MKFRPVRAKQQRPRVPDIQELLRLHMEAMRLAKEHAQQCLEHEQRGEHKDAAKARERAREWLAAAMAIEPKRPTRPECDKH
jgi:hypothetical protein